MDSVVKRMEVESFCDEGGGGGGDGGVEVAPENAKVLSKPSINACSSLENKREKSQKQNSKSKRGDKKYNKLSSFFPKNSLMSFNLPPRESNFSGCKRSDFIENIDDISLDELLNDNYKCPIYPTDKGKKVNSNENLLNSVDKAWSVLTLQKRKNIDNLNTSKDFQTSNSSSKDVLECLDFSSNKDLDTLLLEASKPPLKNCSSKGVNCGPSLPPFSWSRYKPDAVKLSTAKNICQGGFVKVENSLISLKNSNSLSIDLESLTFDESLVPFTRSKSDIPSSTSQDPLDENSPEAITAAQRLYDLAMSSPNQNPNCIIKSRNNRKSKNFAMVGSENQAKSNLLHSSKKRKLSEDSTYPKKLSTSRSSRVNKK